jgi:hypothetical protein
MIVSPEHGYWQVTVELLEENENGKLKKRREVYLVDALDVNMVEKRLFELMEGCMSEWDIVSIVKSKICMAYIK